ncbi:conserved hypothetical protein [Gloeothece citriformis PCC 7424]|uniref:Uncharacterized protein n=1 Tax=Gloeothece citriformis (strain PCC 7424) TaxID=65393 RepID=B7KJP5_GLOC7|nr:COP23 domain-containing protein [Gloeothece citriformis]ACK69494.1 conserved hypothetical protein [Gloeothece citriformis PCC 7424]
MNNLLKISAIGALVTIGLVGVVQSAKAESKIIERHVLACVENAPGEVALVEQDIQETTHPYSDFVIIKSEVVQTYGPKMIFTRTLDSDNPKGAYTPESRCQAIRDRITNLEKSIGVTNLAELTQVGKVNGQRVIAVDKVSRNTVVMTLSGDNAKWKVAKYEVLPKFQALVNSPFVPAAPELIIE